MRKQNDSTIVSREPQDLRNGAKKRGKTLRSVFSAFPIGIAHVRVNREIEWINGALVSILGYTLQELKGVRARVFYATDEEFDRVGTIIYDEVWRGGIGVTDTKLLHKDGRLLDVHLSASAIDAEDFSAGIVITVEDITARKETERLAEALRQSEERFRTLVEKSSEVIVLADTTRRPTYVSPTIHKVLGYTVDEFLALDRLDITHPDFRSTVNTVRTWSSEHPGETITFITRMRHKNGGWRWLENSARNLLHEPSVHAMVVNFHDITERMEAEEALRRSEAKFRSIFEDSVEGIFQSTPEGRYLSVNPALARMYGFGSPGEMMASVKDIGKDLFVNPDDRLRLRALLEETGIAKNCEFQYRRKDGLSGSGSELFMVGMFSMLDVLIGRPMDEILDRINVSKEIKIALTTGNNAYGDLLRLVIAYERANWRELDFWAGKLNLDPDTTPDAYRRSVEWSEQIFRGKETSPDSLDIRG